MMLITKGQMHRLTIPLGYFLFLSASWTEGLLSASQLLAGLKGPVSPDFGDPTSDQGRLEFRRQAS
ncbi:MAG: hypothetical protein RL119_1740 [Actinomycetota bacterium]